MTDRGWIFSKHKQTNHFYDGNIPYEFHLNLAYTVYTEFKYLLNDD